jgi:hypothetical protein
MKHLEQMLATYVYNHCNMYNITIYFCNIHIKHLQYTSETFETIETYSCNMRFQCNISLLLGIWRLVGVSCSPKAAPDSSGCTPQKGDIGRTSGGEATAAAA